MQTLDFCAFKAALANQALRLAQGSDPKNNPSCFIATLAASYTIGAIVDAMLEATREIPDAK